MQLNCEIERLKGENKALEEMTIRLSDQLDLLNTQYRQHYEEETHNSNKMQ